MENYEIKDGHLEGVIATTHPRKDGSRFTKEALEDLATKVALDATVVDFPDGHHGLKVTVTHPGRIHQPHVYAFSVDLGTKKPCQFCPAMLVRGTTNKGKASWFDAEPDHTGRHVNHWVTCPGAAQARKAFRD